MCTYPNGLSLNGWHALLCIANNRHGVTKTTHAIKRHFLIWVTTVRQPTKRWRPCVLSLKYRFICLSWWTRQRIHNTLIVVDRYLRLMWDYKNPLHRDVVDRYLRRMGDYKNPLYLDVVDRYLQPLMEPRLESFCLVHPGVRDKRRVSEIDLSQPRHETAFWWRNNGPVTSQLTEPIKWPNYPLQLIGIFVHTSTYKKESLQQRCRRSTNTTVFDIFVHISIWFES